MTLDHPNTSEGKTMPKPLEALSGIDPKLEENIRRTVAKIPIMETLSISVEGFAPGMSAIRVPYKKSLDGFFDCFHGGLLMTAADTVACFAVMTETGPEQMMATTDMNIRFLAPCTQDCVAIARLIKAGKTLCPVNVDLYEAESGKHVAVAQVNYIRLGGGKKS
ncbi:MAG: PaaI family thioesterase [Vampirovibrionales bacterium]|nr:PaaI family thioesterase [Vampirovibrionales bacterium]